MKIVKGNRKDKKYPVSIFVIPFMFDKMHYDRNIRRLIQGDWNENSQLADNELFPNIRNLIKSEKESSIATRLIRNKMNVKIVSQLDKEKDSAELIDSELYLFKTGIGFYRFQIQYKNVVDIETLTLRNNSIKSIAHNNEKVVITCSKSIIFDEKKHLTNKLNQNCAKAVNYTDGGKELYIDTTDLIGFNSSKEIKVTKSNEEEKYLRYTSIEELDVRDFLNRELKLIKDLSYFNDFAYDDQKMAIKANVFSSCLLEENISEEKSVSDLAFLMSRGYKSTYKKTKSEGSNDFFSTFDNCHWAVSREGVSNIAWLVEDNSTNTFFKETYLDRIENYFYIYILALHQYYGLIKSAQDISQLPSSIKVYSADKNKYKKLMVTYDEINFLSLKCIYHEVTHISHQAQVYNKIFEVLGIDALISEINYEMDRLTSIVNLIREEDKGIRGKKYAIIGSIFAFFAVFEAILNIAVLTKIKSVIELNVDSTLIELSFVLSVLLFGLILGMSVYFFWSKNER